MTPTQIIQAICPSLYSDAGFAVYLQLAEEQTSGTFFGLSRSHAVALRASHMYVLSKGRALGEGGSIVSKTEGKLNISFSGQSGASEDLGQTHYGKQLLGLIQSGDGAYAVTDAGFE